MTMSRSLQPELIIYPRPESLLGQGGGARVFQLEADSTQIIKISRDIIEEKHFVLGKLWVNEKELIDKAENEAKALRRIYPPNLVNVRYVQSEDPNAFHVGIEMPRLYGITLDKLLPLDEKAPEPFVLSEEQKQEIELQKSLFAKLRFSQRIKLALQVVDGYKKLHYPASPHDSAIINPDNHGGNMMVDLHNLQVHLFDFDHCLFLAPGQKEAVLGKKEVVGNDISMSPEAIQIKRIGVKSDSYGLVAQEIFLLGAIDPGKAKRPSMVRGNITESYKEKFALGLEGKEISLATQVSEYNIAVGFDFDGFLTVDGNSMKGIPKPPNFCVSVDMLLREFYERRAERDPDKRASTLEGARFLTIVDAICTRLEANKLKQAESKKVNQGILTDAELFQAAELILLSKGLWYEGCKWTVDDCKIIVDAYDNRELSFIEYLKEKMYQLSEGGFDILAHYSIQDQRLTLDDVILEGRKELRNANKLGANNWFKATRHCESTEVKHQPMGDAQLPEFIVPVGKLLREFYQHHAKRDPSEASNAIESARFLTIVDEIYTRLEPKESKAIRQERDPGADLIQAAELILLSTGLWHENGMSKWTIDDCKFIVDAYVPQRYIEWDDMDRSAGSSDDDESEFSFIESLKKKMHSLSGDGLNVLASYLIKNQQLMVDDMQKMYRLSDDNFNTCIHSLINNRQLTIDDVVLKGKENLKIGNNSAAKKWFQAGAYWGSEEAERQLLKLDVGAGKVSPVMGTSSESKYSTNIDAKQGLRGPMIENPNESSGAKVLRMFNAVNAKADAKAQLIRDANKGSPLEYGKAMQSFYRETYEEIRVVSESQYSNSKFSPLGGFVENLKYYKEIRAHKGDSRFVTFFKEIFGIFTQAQKIATVDKIIAICSKYREELIAHRNVQSEAKRTHPPVFDFSSLTLRDYDILRDGRVGAMIKAYENKDNVFKIGFIDRESSLSQEVLGNVNEAMRGFQTHRRKES